MRRPLHFLEQSRMCYLSDEELRLNIAHHALKKGHLYTYLLDSISK